MSDALSGTRVVDLTRHAPGPYCTMLLGDLGADVVKVEEPPIGDPTRAVPPAVGETSAVFAALNRNKRLDRIEHLWHHHPIGCWHSTQATRAMMADGWPFC